MVFFARFGLPDVLVSDGGPPFNAGAFISFLERQGITVMKSPPYHPPSNGQAERFVRTVKEMMRKFLMERTVMELDLEKQISLFLVTYRNNCLTKDGDSPSERVFSFTPKTLIDLLHPKKQAKLQLQPPPPHDDTNTPKLDGDVHAGSIDPLSNLTAGDELWYKNHNPHVKARWIKSNFIKWHSRNVLQVQTGSGTIMAHRNQIRRCNSDDHVRPNVVVLLKRCDEGGNGNDRGDAQRAGEARAMEPPVEIGARTRKRKCEDSVNIQNSTPRKSKRLKKSTKNDMYIYS